MYNFTQKLFLLGVVALSTLTAGAQTINGRVTRAKSPAKSAQAFTQAPQKQRHMQARVVGKPTDYGTESIVCEEDFSLMTTGSIESPDYSTNINYQNDNNVWINMTYDYTHTPGWGSHNAYPAGGAIYLKTDGQENQGQLNTPMLDASGEQGIVFLQFKARTPKEGDVANYAVVEAAETYNMSPTWDILGSSTLPQVTSEWQTYEVMYYGAGSYTLFNIVAVDAPIVVDDVKVYQIKQYVGTPTAYNHRYYKGDNFNLHWTASEGAEKYLLNVYTVDEFGNVGKYLLQDFEVEGTSYDVTNAVSGETYYYTVTAVKGEQQSIPSEAVEIYDVAPPVLNPVTDITDGRYNATWEEVPEAERYNYLAYYKRIAEKAGEFVMSDIDFTGITDPADTLSGLTIENPSTYTVDEQYVNHQNQAGWHFKNGRAYTDYVCVDGFWYVYGNKDAGLISPELDLSKDGGKFNLSLDLYGTEGTYWGVDDVQYTGYTQCAVALFNYNEELDDYEQVELIYPKDVKDAWQSYNLQFSKGSERSIVGIYAVSYPENLYIDNVKLTQNYEAGDAFLDPFYYGQYIEDTQVDVPVPTFADGKEIYHSANAVRAAYVQGYYGYEADLTEGDYSPIEKVGEGISTSISHAKADFASATVKMEGGKLVVNNPAGDAVEIYAVNGASVYSNHGGQSTVTSPALGHGIYVVKVGKKSIKVTF